MVTVRVFFSNGLDKCSDGEVFGETQCALCRAWDQGDCFLCDGIMGQSAFIELIEYKQLYVVVDESLYNGRVISKTKRTCWSFHAWGAKKVVR